MKMNARQCFEHHFDVDRNGIQFLEMLRSLRQKTSANPG
jgi:hypothetical protein